MKGISRDKLIEEDPTKHGFQRVKILFLQVLRIPTRQIKDGHLNNIKTEKLATEEKWNETNIIF